MHPAHKPIARVFGEIELSSLNRPGMKFLINDYRPLFPEHMNAEETFRNSLGRDLTPQERHYLALAEIALGPLPEDIPSNRHSDPELTKTTAA